MDRFILIGAGRCGTTLYIDSIAQKLNCFREIFCRYSKTNDWSIFDFDTSKYNEPFTISLEENQKRCWAKYCKVAHKKYTGYKILYDHIANDVLDYIRTIPTIQVVRRNRLAHFVSVKATQLTRSYFYNEFDLTVTVDPDEYRSFSDWVTIQDQLYKAVSGITIYYEDDYQENMDKICDFLEIDRFVPAKPLNKQVKRPLSEVIINYEEVRHLDKNMARI